MKIMSEEKQIEEMAELMCGNNADGICSADYHACDHNCEYGISALYLYRRGYRKQNKGVWLTDKFGFERSICSVCGGVFESGGNYCRKCGAKMNTGMEATR